MGGHAHLNERLYTNIKLVTIHSLRYSEFSNEGDVMRRLTFGWVLWVTLALGIGLSVGAMSAMVSSPAIAGCTGSC